MKKPRGWTDKFDGRWDPERPRRTTLGVIVGRFQVHELHPGHLKLISHARSRHSRVLILLCSKPQKRNRLWVDDPLDHAMREGMLKSYFPDIEISPLLDVKGDNKLWSKVLDNNVYVFLKKGQVPYLYGSRNSFIPYYRGKYKTVEIPEFTDSSGTTLRRSVANRIVNSPDFRAGVIYATYQMRGNNK